MLIFIAVFVAVFAAGPYLDQQAVAKARAKTRS
jgi:hypothetical protein